MTDISDDEINHALANIGRTNDGRVLYAFLQRTLMGVARTSESGALQIHHGARTFAADLMGRMAPGIAEHSREYGSGGRYQLNVFVAPKPVNVGRRQSAREHLAAGDDTTE